MRLLIRTYTITGQHEITITGYDFTNQDVRLIINETKASSAQTDLDLINSVLVSSTKKGNIISVSNGVITLASTTANLTVGDDLTIEIDIDNIGLLEEIIEAINGDNVDGMIDSFMDDYAEQLQAILGVENDSDSSSESE